MNTNGKPMIQIGGLQIHPQALLDNVSKGIPYLLINTRIFEEKNQKPKNINDAVENVIKYANRLKESKGENDKLN